MYAQDEFVDDFAYDTKVDANALGACVYVWVRQRETKTMENMFGCDMKITHFNSKQTQEMREI